MNKRHKYEYSIDLSSETAPAKVIRMVGMNKRVLEIGAGPGSITRILKEHNQCIVTAIERDSQAIELLRPYCEMIYQYDLNDSSWTSVVSQARKFEVIVVADVLEHLFDPWTTLQTMQAVLEPGGVIIVSLPHVGHSAVIACLIDEDFEYRDWGLLDKTHIRFFGIKNIQNLFDRAGLKIIDAEFVLLAPEHTEFAERWLSLPSNLRRHLSRNQYGLVYQVVIKAVIDSAPGQRIDLASLPVTSSNPTIPANAPFGTKCKITIRLISRRFLGPRLSTLISDWLLSCGFHI